MIRRHLAYLKYVLRHKWFVFQECRKLDVPLWIAVVHDWDKFLPDEWFPYARTFYKSDGSKQYVESPEFARAWALHQKRNRHHWQYWLSVGFSRIRNSDRYMVWDRGTLSAIERDGKGWREIPLATERCDVFAEPMPDRDRREMLADWRGAGRAIMGDKSDTREWYLKNAKNMILHPDTRRWIEDQLGVCNGLVEKEASYADRT